MDHGGYTKVMAWANLMAVKTERSTDRPMMSNRPLNNNILVFRKQFWIRNLESLDKEK